MPPTLAMIVVGGSALLVLGVVFVVVLLAARAMTVKNDQLGQLAMGQNGRTLQWIYATFTGTNATDTVKVKLRKVEAVIINAAAAQNTDEDFYWADTKSADGTFAVPATGVITIGRTGTKTNNIPVNVIVLGY